MLLGVEILPAAPAVVARRGVAHVPEGRGLMPSLTVIENLRVAAFAARQELTPPISIAWWASFRRWRPCCRESPAR